MGNLIRFELRKLYGQKKLYLCGIIAVAVMLLYSLIEYGILSLFSYDPSALELPGAEKVLGVLNTASFVMICGIFAVLCVTEDYSRKIVKNIFSRGYSRLHVYLAKYIAVLIGVSLMFVAVILMATAISAILYGLRGVDAGTFFKLLAAQYIVVLANATMAFSIGAMLGKVAAALPIVILAPSILTMILNLIDLFIFKEKEVIAPYWLGSLLGEVSDVNVSDTRVLICLLLSLGYVAMWLVLGYLPNRRREV